MKPIISLTAAIALTFGAAQALYAQSDDALSPPGGQDPSFDQVDADGDGQISREEAAAAGLSLDWSQADSDGTGFLTQEEYDSAVGAGQPGLEADPGAAGTDPAAPGADPGMGADPGGMGTDPGAGDPGVQ